MFEAVAAGLVLAVCLALLARQVMPPGRRDAIDQRVHALWARLRELPGQVKRERSVKREASDVIEKARRASRRSPPAAEREGNVIRPDAFRSSRPPSDRLH